MVDIFQTSPGGLRDAMLLKLTKLPYRDHRDVTRFEGDMIAKKCERCVRWGDMGDVGDEKSWNCGRCGR